VKKDRKFKELYKIIKIIILKKPEQKYWTDKNITYFLVDNRKVIAMNL
jgi:hypothetical protein